VARGQSDWLSVRLALATETQVFDTSVPFGKNVPPINDLTSFRLAVGPWTGCGLCMRIV